MKKILLLIVSVFMTGSLVYGQTKLFTSTSRSL